METAIQKAIEGGYKSYRGFEFIDVRMIPGEILIDLIYPHEGGVASSTVSRAEIWSDPLFWQALGKSLGWKNTEILLQEKPETATMATWHYQWRCLIDWLAKGKDAESFFRELTEEKI